MQRSLGVTSRPAGRSRTVARSSTKQSPLPSHVSHRLQYIQCIQYIHNLQELFKLTMEYFKLLDPINGEYIVIDCGTKFASFKEIVKHKYLETKGQRGGTPMADLLKMFVSLFFKKEMSIDAALLGVLPEISGWISVHLLGHDPNPVDSMEQVETFINDAVLLFDEHVLYEIFMYFIQIINTSVPVTNVVPSITSHLVVHSEWLYIDPLVRVMKEHYKLAVLKHIHPGIIRPDDQDEVKQALDKLKYTDDRMFRNDTSIFDITNLDNICNLVLEIIKKLKKEPMVANNEFRLSFQRMYEDSFFATMPVDMYNYYIIIKNQEITLKIVNYSDHFDYLNDDAYTPDYKIFESTMSQPDIFFDMEVTIGISEFNIDTFKTKTTELLTKFINRLAVIYDVKGDAYEDPTTISDFRNIILNFFGFTPKQAVFTDHKNHTPVLKYIQAIRYKEGSERSKILAASNLSTANPFTFQKMRVYFKDLPNDGKDVLERMFPPGQQQPHAGGKWKSTGRKITCPDGKRRILFKNKKESSVRVRCIKNGKRCVRHRLLIRQSN